MNRVLALPILPFYVLIKFRNFAISLMILIISIGPRIHLGRLQYGKLLDIRYEDIFIVILAISCFLYWLIKPQKLYLTPIGKPILLYLLAMFVSTSIGIIAGWIDPLRALFFYLKEVEYFLFFFITANLIQDNAGLKSAIFAFLAGVFINGIYGFYQIYTGNIGSGLDDPTDPYRHYGISTLSESSPAIVGSYFSMMLFLSATITAFISRKDIKLMSFLCALFALGGLAASFNRGSVWGSVLVVPFWLYFFLFYNKKLKKKLQFLFIFLILISVTPFFYRLVKENPFAKRILTINTLTEAYYTERVTEVYYDYFKIISSNPLTGLGKSITGDQSILENIYGTAHNQYIGILAETGIVGLLIFLYLIWCIIRFSYKIYTGNFNPFYKMTGFTCLIWTIMLVITSFAHDAFIIAKLAELFWVMTGLMMGVYRFQQMKTT